MAFTYDLSTSVGGVRLMIGDTVDSGHVFEDDELEYFLDECTGDVREAACAALASILASQMRLARRMKLGGYEVEQRAKDDILAAIEAIRETGGATGIVAVDIEGNGEFFGDYREEWVED